MSTRHRRLEWVSYLYLGLVTVLLLFAAVVIIEFHADVPLRDQWRIFLTYLAAPGLAGTWAPQNGHIMFFPGLLYQADMAWFSGSGHMLIGTMHVFNVLVAALLARAALAGEASTRLWRTVVAFILFILFWMGSTLHLTWSQGIAHHMTVFSAMASIFSVQRAGRLWGSLGGKVWWVLALLWAIVSSYSFGNGLLVWPLVLVAGQLSGLRRWPLWILGIAMIIAVTVYVTAIPAGGSGRPWVQATWKHFLDMGVIFLGAPVAHALDFLVPVTSRATVSVARWAGLVMVTLGLVATLQMWKEKVTAPGPVLALATMAMVIGTALLVAWTRVEQFGPAIGASQRYVVWGVLYLAALAALLPHLLSERWRESGIVVVIIVTMLMIPSHLKMGMASGMEAQRSSEAVLALAAKVRDDRGINAIADSGQIDLVYKASPPLLKREMSPFNDPVMRLTGTQVNQRFEVVSPDRCWGKVENIDPIGGSNPMGWRMSGWAWDLEENTAPRYVITINHNGTINGVARFSRSGQLEDLPEGTHPSVVFKTANALSARLPGMLGLGHGWFGYAQASQKMLAMAVLADGKSACPLVRN